MLMIGGHSELLMLMTGGHSELLMLMIGGHSELLMLMIGILFRVSPGDRHNLWIKRWSNWMYVNIHVNNYLNNSKNYRRYTKMKIHLCYSSSK